MLAPEGVPTGYLFLAPGHIQSARRGGRVQGAQRLLLTLDTTGAAPTIGGRRMKRFTGPGERGPYPVAAGVRPARNASRSADSGCLCAAARATKRRGRPPDPRTELWVQRRRPVLARYTK